MNQDSYLIEEIYTYVLARDSLNDVFWRCTKELRYDRELVHVWSGQGRSDQCPHMHWSLGALLTILSREKRLPLQHLCEYTPCTPNIDRNVILLPCEHNFGCPVVPGGDVSSHLRILNTGQTKIADLDVIASRALVTSCSLEKKRENEYRTFKSQFSLIRMLLGFFRCTSSGYTRATTTKKLLHTRSR